MEKHKIKRKIIGFLLIVAIIWFIYDNFGIFPVMMMTYEGEDTEFSIGNFNTKKTAPDIRALRVEMVSFSKSYSGDSMDIEIKNVDDVRGNVTVMLKCSGDDKKKIRNIASGKTELFAFSNLDGTCEDYVIEPGDVVRRAGS